MTKEIAWAHKVYQTKDKAKSLQVFEFINNIIINSKKNAYNYLNLLDEPQKEGKGTFLSHGYLLKNILLGIRDLKTYLSLPYLTHTHKEENIILRKQPGSAICGMFGFFTSVTA